MNRIYLDHAATTPMRREVIEAMQPYLGQYFGNPSSLHHFGKEAAAAISDAREKVAGLLSARPDEVVFVSGGTESENLAVFGAAYANRDPGRHILTPQIAHYRG